MSGFLQKTPVKKQESKIMTKKMQVGIAGYGIVGKRRHHYIKQRDDMEVVSVCDRVLKDGTKNEEGIPCYHDYKSMLKQEKLDVLLVCLTNDIAPEVTIAGLEAGLHVFCEKPPGRNVADIENVREVEAKHENLKLMYGFNHRYHDSVQEALNIIKSGELGKIINLRGVYGKSKLITFNQDDWRTKREIAGGGVLLDQGIHMVDLMRLFAGEFEQVHSFVSNNFWSYGVEDNAYAIMKTSSGIVGMLHSSATQWRHRFSLEINLEKGSINLGGILSGSKSYGAETMTIVWAEPDSDNGDPREQTVRYNKDPSWATELNVFAEAVKSDIKIDHGGSYDALKTMELVYNIYKSDKEWSKKFNIT
jgi:predicted dehydrogenase